MVLFILLFMFAAAPLASFIPLAGLAGVLAVVARNMAEKDAFVTLVRTSAGDAVVLILTFGLTVLVGLTEAIVVGFALGTLLFLHRMAQSADVEMHVPPVPGDRADEPGRPYDAATATDPDVAVYRITGAFSSGPLQPSARSSTALPIGTRPSSSTSRPCRSSTRR